MRLFIIVMLVAALGSASMRAVDVIAESSGIYPILVTVTEVGGRPIKNASVKVGDSGLDKIASDPSSDMSSYARDALNARATDYLGNAIVYIASSRSSTKSGGVASHLTRARGELVVKAEDFVQVTVSLAALFRETRVIHGDNVALSCEVRLRRK